MRDRVVVVEERDVSRLAGEGVEGGAADEAQRALGEDRGDVGAGVDQPAADLDGLVGGDATGDPEDDAGTGEGHGEPSTSPGSCGGSALVALGGRRPPRRRPRRRRPPRPRASKVGTIRPSAISSKAIDSGLRAVDATWGGMPTWPSVSRLK